MKSHRPALPLALLAIVILLLLGACGGQPATTAPAATEAPAATKAPASTEAADQPAPAATVPQPTTVPPTAVPEPTATTPPTTAPEPTQPPASTAAPATGSHNLDEVMKAAQAQLAQKGYRVRITSESGGTKTDMNVEFVAPDRYHIVSPATEMIIIANKTYMKQDAAWVQVPMDMSAMLEQMQDPALMMEATGLKLRNVNYKGAEDVDGVAADAYEYDSTLSMQGTAYDSHSQLWVDRKSGLPLKSVGTSELSGIKSVTTSLYEYPVDLKIEAPIK
jgi:hypothetical protein